MAQGDKKSSQKQAKEAAKAQKKYEKELAKRNKAIAKASQQLEKEKALLHKLEAAKQKPGEKTDGKTAEQKDLEKKSAEAGDVSAEGKEVDRPDEKQASSGNPFWDVPVSWGTAVLVFLSVFIFGIGSEGSEASDSKGRIEKATDAAKKAQQKKLAERRGEQKSTDTKLSKEKQLIEDEKTLLHKLEEAKQPAVDQEKTAKKETVQINKNTLPNEAVQKSPLQAKTPAEVAQETLSNLDTYIQSMKDDPNKPVGFDEGSKALTGFYEGKAKSAPEDAKQLGISILTKTGSTAEFMAALNAAKNKMGEEKTEQFHNTISDFLNSDLNFDDGAQIFRADDPQKALQERLTKEAQVKLNEQNAEKAEAKAADPTKLEIPENHALSEDARKGLEQFNKYCEAHKDDPSAKHMTALLNQQFKEDPQKVEQFLGGLNKTDWHDKPGESKNMNAYLDTLNSKQATLDSAMGLMNTVEKANQTKAIVSELKSVAYGDPLTRLGKASVTGYLGKSSISVDDKSNLAEMLKKSKEECPEKLQKFYRDFGNANMPPDEKIGFLKQVNDKKLSLDKASEALQQKKLLELQKKKELEKKATQKSKQHTQPKPAPVGGH